MAKEICQDCENVFEAGPYTFFCPECRKKRMSESAKRRNLNKIGNDAYSLKQAIRRRADNGK